jgi:hypothetical protein
VKLPQTGKCLCGTIGYEITEAPISTYVCHCRDCQRGTGSAFSVGILVPDHAFRSTIGQTRLVFGGVTLDGRVKQRRVCPDCGTWVFGDARQRGTGTTPTRAVRAGTLDDISWLCPTRHLFTRDAQPWVVIPADVDRYDTTPGR